MDRKTLPGEEASLREATVQEELPRESPPLIQEQPRTIPRLNTSPLHGLWALTKRDLKKWYTNPYQLLISLIQPAVWLGLFGKAIPFGSFGTTSYFSFLACGMLAFIILFTSAFSGMSVVFDRRFGFLNKALSTPVGRGTVVMAKVLQSVVRSLIQSAIVLGIAVVLGMDTSQFSVLGLLGSFVFLFLIAMGLSSLFVMLALRSSNWQTQMAIINLLNLPLLFASNALFPTTVMPSWLQDIVKVNPVSYANDGVRQLLLGVIGANSLIFDFAYLIGFAGLFSIVGIVLSWRLLSK
jgi:ABC-2 type transport system permease protein